MQAMNNNGIAGNPEACLFYCPHVAPTTHVTACKSKSLELISHTVKPRTVSVRYDTTIRRTVYSRRDRVSGAVIQRPIILQVSLWQPPSQKF